MKVTKEERSYVQVKMPASYVDNPEMRKTSMRGRDGERGAGPTEYTTGLLSCVRGEESNLQEPNY